jgi:hypothetical protein
MENAKKMRASLVVAGMLLVVAWMAWPDKSPEEPQVTRQIEDSPTGDSGITGLTDSAEEPEAGSGQPPLLSMQDAALPLTSSLVLIDAAQATSAGRLQELAAQARASGDEALARRLELMEEDACGPLIRNDIADNLDQEGYRRLEVFCADSIVDPSTDAMALRQEFVDQVNVEFERKQERFLDFLDSMDPEDAYLRLLSESMSPAEIEAVDRLGMREYTGIDLLSHFIPELRGLVDENRRLLTNSAVTQIYACERFGHCGPGSMETILPCLLNGCQPGDDYYDLLRWHLSARDQEHVWRIIELIQHREARGDP